MSHITVKPTPRVPGAVTYVPESAFKDCQFGTLDDSPSKIVGDYILAKYRHRAQQVGVQTVAKQLRKQGFEPEIAVLILAVRP